ncbi:MAG: DUF6177 family protein [Ornithinimicrobium sp.]
MSEDWLVTTARSVQWTELHVALEQWGGGLRLRRTKDGSCALIADVGDHALAWVTPSVPVDNEDGDVARDHHLPGLNADRGWCTEIVVPASPHQSHDTPGTRALARAIAHAAGGEALPLSTIAGVRRSPRASSASRARPVDDMACDVRSEAVAIFLQTRHVLAMTGWVRYAMSWAAAHDLGAVFVTPHTTELSVILRHLAERGACRWIQQTSEALIDGLDGVRLIWDGQDFRPAATSGPRRVRVASTRRWDVLRESGTRA